ncbi:DUF4861 domain-containing protein [Echinicola sediminis]
MNIKFTYFFRCSMIKPLFHLLGIVGAALLIISCNVHRTAQIRTYARHVPERADDFAWENDLVAFRAYGPTMRKRTEDSGIDCWLKRVDYPIIDKWYKGNEAKQSYHRDHGEGYDPYHVGSSRGCGGLGLWIEDTLITSNTYTEWKIIKSKKRETVFVLTYDWEYQGDNYKEEKQISIHLGDRFYSVASTFWKNGQLAVGLPLAIGITTHDGKAEVTKDLSAGYMTCWENIDGFGVGTGVVMDPNRISAFKLLEPIRKDEGNALLITSTDALGKVEYKAGYGWEKEGTIKTSADWSNYLQNVSEND